MQPYRSLLFVPAHREGWVAKALRHDVDALILDLEDAVPAAAKADARAALAEGAALVRATAPHVGVLVRCNGPEEPAGMARDLEAAVAAGADAVLVPKVDAARDVTRAQIALDHVAARDGVARPEVMVSLETASGLLHAGAIMAHPASAGALCAAARDGDAARSIGFTWTSGGQETRGFRSQAVLACRAQPGRHPVVGLWQELADLEGLAAFATDNAALGFGGQVVIHPSHVDAVNAAYSPADATVDYYRGMLAAWEAAEEGEGAVRYGGDHVDIAHVTTARQVVAVADRLAQRR